MQKHLSINFFIYDAIIFCELLEDDKNIRLLWEKNFRYSLFHKVTIK